MYKYVSNTCTTCLTFKFNWGKMWAGLALSEALCENFWFFSSSWWVQVFLGLQCTSHFCFCLHMAFFPLAWVSCVSLNLPLFIKISIIRNRIHPNSVCIHLTLIISAKTLFPSELTFTATVVQNLNICFGETQFNSQQAVLLVFIISTSVN